MVSVPAMPRVIATPAKTQSLMKMLLSPRRQMDFCALFHSITWSAKHLRCTLSSAFKRFSGNCSFKFLICSWLLLACQRLRCYKLTVPGFNLSEQCHLPLPWLLNCLGISVVLPSLTDMQTNALKAHLMELPGNIPCLTTESSALFCSPGKPSLSLHNDWRFYLFAFQKQVCFVLFCFAFVASTNMPFRMAASHFGMPACKSWLPSWFQFPAHGHTGRKQVMIQAVGFLSAMWELWIDNQQLLTTQQRNVSMHDARKQVATSPF